MIVYVVIVILFLLLFNKLTCAWCYNKVCLVGKTAIVTGGNAGIGFQTALSLASRGCRVIIAGRNNLNESRDNIIRETKNSNVVAMYLDLTSLDSVRRFAKEIEETESELHILINNAGVGTTESKYTTDGLQQTMQVNYFGHFLLTHLLLGLLKKSSPSRIIFNSSVMAFITANKLKVEDVNPPMKFLNILQSYSNSKLCGIIAAKCFSEKLKGTDVTAYSCHPGFVRSEIFTKSIIQQPHIGPMILGFFALVFGKSVEEGAQTLIYLATDKYVQQHSGDFFIDCCRCIRPGQANDAKFCEDVWNESIECVKLSHSECLI